VKFTVVEEPSKLDYEVISETDGARPDLHLGEPIKSVIVVASGSRRRRGYANECAGA